MPRSAKDGGQRQYVHFYLRRSMPPCAEILFFSEPNAEPNLQGACALSTPTTRAFGIDLGF